MRLGHMYLSMESVVIDFRLLFDIFCISTTINAYTVLLFFILATPGSA